MHLVSPKQHRLNNRRTVLTAEKLEVLTLLLLF